MPIRMLTTSLQSTRFRGTCAALALFSAGVAHAAPAILYTDLASAPTGAYVTVFGRGLSGATVSGADVFSQTDTQVVLKWKGTAATIGGISVPVTTSSGRVLEATPSTLGSLVKGVKSGDVIYLRGGTYSGQYGTTTWGNQRLILGSWASGSAYVGYPGEVAKIADARTDDGAGLANNVTFANLSMSASQCIHGGSWWESEESGSTGVRVVNVTCAGNYGSANTMTGLIDMGGDNWKVLGNTFSNNAPAPINNNHAVYVNVGADNIEIAWNKFANMKMGHVIQQHTDGQLRQYDNISIHDNELRGTSAQDIRGINISGCTASSTADIYNNVLINLGQSFSGIMIYCGTVKVRHNTLANIAAAPLNVQGGTVTAQNNIFIGQAITKAGGTLTQGTNITSGTVDSTGRMTNAPTAPNVGINVDHVGAGRGATVSVGAFEGNAAPRPNAPSNVMVQ
jgi:hypothetical protein